MARTRTDNLPRCQAVRTSLGALLASTATAAAADPVALLHATTHEATRQIVHLGVFVVILLLALVAALVQRNRQLAGTRRALNAALAKRDPVLAALPDLVSLKDLHGRYLSCNAAFASVFQCDESDIVGQRDHDLVDRQIARRWRAADRAALEAGRAIDNEEWLALPEKGYTALLLFTRKPLFDNDGRLVGVLSIGRDVTVHHRAERELHKRESYKRALLDNFPFLVWLKDTEGRFLAVNQPLADAAGVDDPLSLINKTDLDIWPRETAEAYRRDDRAVLVTRRRRNVEEEIEDRGTRKWIETYRGPVIDDRGQLLGTVGFARDVSERHAAEQALRDSEERFRTFFANHSAVLIFIEPESATIIDANEAAVRFYGYPRDRLVGMSVDQIITLSHDQAREMRRKIVAGTQTHFEHQHRLASGDMRDVEIYAAVVNTGGQDLQLSIVHDVTERKRTQRELEQERRLFSNGPVVVFTWEHSEGCPVREVSSNCEAVFGYPADEVRSASFRFVDIIHPKDLPCVLQEVREHLAAGVDQFEQSYRLRHKHDGYIWVHDVNRVERDGHGRIESIRGYLLDQTQAKQLEISLADERRRLEHVIEGTGVGTWEWNVQTGETRFNEHWAEIIGYRLNQLVPVSIDTWVRHTHPDDLGRSEAILKRHFAGEVEYYECEARMRHRDGHWVWVLDRGRVFEWTDGGDPLWMYGTHLDITERKLTEQRLRESEDRLRMAGRSSYDLLYEWHVDTGRLEWFSDIDVELGFEPGKIGNKRQAWLALIHPDDLEKMHDSVERQRQSVDPVDHQYRIRRADGSYRLWRDKAVPVLDDADRPSKWVGVCTDITELHTAEERQRLAAAVFNHAHEGILVTDSNARIIDVNHAFTGITGYTREEALGRNPSFLGSGRQDVGFYRVMWQTLTERGHWSGEIWNRRKDGRVYAEHLSITAICDAQGRVERYVALFSDITTLKEQQSKLERIAYYDALTDLPNRVMLGDRLQQAMRHAERTGTTLAVVYLDLDGFKAINDAHGHAVGDAVLVELAARLADSLRDDDTLARLGGDEFVAILADLDEHGDCAGLLPRMLEAAARPLNVGRLQFNVSGSLGVALYPQAEALDADQLLRQADHAMYQAKLAGKNRYVFFDAEQDQSIRGQTERIEEVRAALHSGAFVLHYQPKVNMRSGEVIGVEALIRWPQADGSQRPPAEFLPLIEHNDLASLLDEWVIGQALTQLEAWQIAGLRLSVSVNVSAYHLQQSDFIGRLRRLLDAHPSVDPGDLIIEVLETTALMDLARMSEVIRTAQAMGVVFALDDFGTGFSSLDYLKNLPARQLKIDRSFVRNMLDDRDDLAILEGIVGLANAFSRDLIAEGVEVVEHGEILLRLGCDVAQGFGIGRPMPAAQLPAWIADWQPDPSWRDQRPISRDDLPLMFAMVEHRAWVKALQSQLNGKQLPSPEIDQMACNFGRWLNGPGSARYRREPGFTTVDRLHREIHDHATEILALERHGDSAAALVRLDEVCRLRDSLIGAMKELLH